MQIIIVMPVYQDWESAATLCAAIDECLAISPNIDVSVLVVDDGSGIPIPTAFPGYVAKVTKPIRILRLRRNLGHQRAIAVALAYVHHNLPGDAVLVMDADGEDRPEDIQRMIDLYEVSPIPIAVFAERGRRVESLSFKLLYECYKVMHLVLTGRSIRFGNFSLLPRQHLDSLVAYPELWNHYAAAVVKSGLSYTTIRADRGTRLCGKSKMRLVGLVIHGLSALFASYELVSTRMLVGTAILAALSALLLFVVFSIKIFTTLGIPGWATFTSGFLFVLVAQAAATSVTIIFSVMMSRNNLGFLPIRDYEYFIADCIQIEKR